MGRLFLLSLIMSGAALAAPPIPGSPVADVPEGVSDGTPMESDLGIPLSMDADTTINVCVIKVEFLPDYTETTTGSGEFESDSAEVADLMSQVEDYFYDVSGGQVHLNLTQYPSENGAFLLNHQMEYYGADDKNGLGQCQLMQDAIEEADDVIDFSGYGAVIILHAGAGNEADILGNSPGDIHSMFIGSSDLEYYLGISYISTDDGVRIRESSIDPEREAQDDYGLSPLGTIVHEFGHQLGLPDLYNTYDGTVGVGGWDLMGYGQWLMNGYWPAAPGAWSRMALGWESPRVITPGEYTAEQQGTVYRIPLTSTEYLLIENRQRDPDGNGQCGPHERDFGLPGSGILIWHVDETRLGYYRQANIVNVDPLHKGVDVEEADGIQDLDYGFPTWFSIEGSEYDPWKKDGYAWEFTPETTPSTEASWGGYTGAAIEVLSNSDNSMNFVYSLSGSVPGWPVQLSAGRFGPVLWSPPQGDFIVAVQGNYQAMAVPAEGGNPVPVGLNVTAPPVVCEVNGIEYILVCQEGGEIHLRLPNWTEAPGWPVDLGESVFQAICSSSQSSIYLILENNDLYRINLNGAIAQGSPTSFAIPLEGGCVFPDADSPGLVLSSADGSLRRIGPAGGTIFGWPVHPGSEEITLPVSGDFDRDGDIEVAVVSGGKVWSYSADSAIEPGFPAYLQGEVLSDPFLADIEGDGHIEILVETTAGIEAFTSSGTRVSDWPFETPTDSLVYEYEKFSSGIGGNGFLCVPLRDGRVFLWGHGSFAFGDNPRGTPVLHRFSGEERYRLTAMAGNGLLNAFYTSFEPSGWHTGMDRGGERCWYTPDMPDLETGGTLLPEEDFYVWPNPVKDDLGYIRFVPGNDSDYSINIFNVAGELVGQFEGSSPGGAPWEIAWDTEDLAPGVYYVCLEITSGGETAQALFHAAVVN